jgi:hypothetical protein
MINLLIPLLIIFFGFGAFCFNMGHRRAYRIVLKGLLKGQIQFLSQRKSYLEGNRGKLSEEVLKKGFFSYETIGQQVIGWYKYFRAVRDDKELRSLKGQMKEYLEDFLALIESIDPRLASSEIG